MANVSIDKLDNEIAKQLTQYTETVAKGVKQVVEEVSQEMLKNIKADAPVRYGKYKKAMRLKTSFEDRYELHKLWYVAKPQYRLTHLLEKGHAKRNGGRTRAYPHIQKNEEAAKEQLEKRIMEVIERGN